ITIISQRCWRLLVRLSKTSPARKLNGKTVIRYLNSFSRCTQPRDVVMKLYAVSTQSVGSKRMEECSVFLIPVFKFNTQLKRGAGFFDEVNFVDTQREVKRADAGNGRLTNTHSANLLRLNQGNCGCFFLEETGQTCRRHPAGSTPAD